MNGPVELDVSSSVSRLTETEISFSHSFSVTSCINIMKITIFGAASHDVFHDDVIKWKHFSHYWPFERGIPRSPLNSPHKGQWRGALTFSLICVWINGWVNTREAGDLRRYHVHYDVIVILLVHFAQELTNVTATRVRTPVCVMTRSTIIPVPVKWASPAQTVKPVRYNTVPL